MGSAEIEFASNVLAFLLINSTKVLLNGLADPASYQLRHDKEVTHGG